MTELTRNIVSCFIGKKIRHFKIDEAENCFWIVFTEGPQIKLEDFGQQCCEKRFMKCDDDIKRFDNLGCTFIGIEKLPVEEESAEGDICFVNIKTSEGDIRISNYNDHNGYYGGFDISITVCCLSLNSY